MTTDLMVCSVQNCTRKVFADGYCNSHHAGYVRLKLVRESKISKYTSATVAPNEKIQRVPGFEHLWAAESGILLNSRSGVQKAAPMYPSKFGYLYSVVWNGGRYRKVWVHRAVLMAFGTPPQQGQECRHLDGNRTNNQVSNLQWCCHKQNMADVRKHGRTPDGSRNGNHKLTEEEVREIRGEKQSSGVALAKRFGVTPTLISAIRLNRIWKHVEVYES